MIDFMVENEIVTFSQDPFTLFSNKKSHFYIDWRPATHHTALLQQIIPYILEKTREHNLQPAAFVGTPEGCTALGIATTLNYNENTIIPVKRIKEKKHGTNNHTCVVPPAGSIVVLEDTTTTGSSLLYTINKLTKEGCTVDGAIVLTDKCVTWNESETVKERFLKRNIPYIALTSAPKVLEKCYEQRKIPENLLQKIKEEYLNNGIALNISDSY